MTPERELALLRLLRGLSAQLDSARDDERLLRRGLREAREFFGAEQGCIALPCADPPGVVLHHAVPDSESWDLPLLAAFLRGERPRLPFELLVAPIRRRGRTWGALALRRSEGEFERGVGWGVVLLAGHVAQLLDRVDEERVRDVRARLDRKVMDQLRPHDLFYQILDAVRAVTHYDHSSALFVAPPDAQQLELVAEQLAWHKGGSRRIGAKLAFSDELRQRLGSDAALAFARVEGRWVGRDAASEGAVALAALLEAPAAAGSATESSGAEGAEDGTTECLMLCAPIVTRRGVIGVLKASARTPGILDRFEMGLLRQFTPHASVAVQHLHVTENLHGRMLEAERKNAIATIARGIAHDVNNALGSVLPLVQQLQSDLERGDVRPAQAADDLRQVEEAVQYCRRIFRNMTSFAVPSPGRLGHANVRRAVDGTLAMLRSSLDRAAIRVALEVGDELPHVRGVQGDLERLLFNLITNARDAMPDGGTLTLSARSANGRADLRVQDTGHGMTPAVLERIYEPGYTTKDEGSGLGLAVCRAIVWNFGGEMAISSNPELGTEVRVLLPAAEGEELRV